MSHKQAKKLDSYLKLLEKELIASYQVAHLLAKHKKHILAQNQLLHQH